MKRIIRAHRLAVFFILSYLSLANAKAFSIVNPAVLYLLEMADLLKSFLVCVSVVTSKPPPLPAATILKRYLSLLWRTMVSSVTGLIPVRKSHFSGFLRIEFMIPGMFGKCELISFFSL